MNGLNLPSQMIDFRQIIHFKSAESSFWIFAHNGTAV
jgi:hypothetical protein